MKIKFERLDYQELAVNSIIDIFENIEFKSPQHHISNRFFDKNVFSRDNIKSNIKKIREKNGVEVGEVKFFDDDLTIDVLMETGTGKTFTFIETIYKLNKVYKLSKFIILTPSSAIREGTLKNLDITKEFFYREYNKNISIFDYNEKTIENFINNSNQNISILISTYQSFNKATNSINKQKLERNLFEDTKSYMESLGKLNSVIIIDEPHRFEGKQTTEYLKKFNPLFTLRFGATFKSEYQNLIYTLDSVEAFNKNLVKSITVDTVGDEDVNTHTIEFKDIKNKIATIRYKDINLKDNIIEVKEGDNLGEVTKINYLSSYVVEQIKAKEIIFTNSITLKLNEISSYGVLLSQIQELIIERTIEAHFEREEELFKLGIKSLTLIFIDSVDRYHNNGELSQLFERKYKKYLDEYLQKELSSEYRKYLEKTKDDINKIHKGYFAKSKKDKDEIESINLILKEKEKLLSFESDLRFIFSMWALQEGWDNPNIFTLAKLSPSDSKITKLQQIGRGLRLALNQDGKRITNENSNFNFVNDLNVIVPSTEEDFVKSIQLEIGQNSLTKISKFFNDKILEDNKITNNTRVANKLLDILEDFEIVNFINDEQAQIIASKDKFYNSFDDIKKDIEKKNLQVNIENLKNYFDEFFTVDRKIKTRDKNKQKGEIKIDREKYQEFKRLWESINQKAVIKYDVDSKELIENIKEKINQNFEIEKQNIIITTQKKVENLHKKDITTTSKELNYQPIFTIYEFIKELSNHTKLTYQTVAKVLRDIDENKFKMIALNENLALKKLKDIFLESIYGILINKISYDIQEIEVKNTTLTDKNGDLKEFINIGTLGVEQYFIENENVLKKSLYDEDFMEIDSKIEKDTIDESNIDNIVVFAKLPKVNIPVLNGKYNPDFGYVIKKDGKEELNLIIETKGFNNLNEISDSENYKIQSAKKFFEALKQKGFNVSYKTKINNQKLIDIIKGS